MFRVEIDATPITEKSGKIKNGARAGEDYSIRTQTGYVDLGGKYPEKIAINLADDQKPYLPGFYWIAPESAGTGDFDSILFRRQLVLWTEKQAADYLASFKGRTAAAA